MLCDVPTPALILDCTTFRRSGLQLGECIETLTDPSFEGLLYVHTAVLQGRDAQSYGAVGTTTRGASTAGTRVVDATVLARLDASRAQCGLSAYVGLGLNNHFTGGYYWGRCSGPGAALPAPGVSVDDDREGQLQLVRTEGEENSNDGKRSEWCEFLVSGDQIQLPVRANELAASGSACFKELVGICRDGDGGVPPGAEPRVEAVWTRSEGESWHQRP